MRPDRVDRPRPLLDGIRWLFAPIVAWWGFAAVAPSLVYLLFALVGVMLLIQLLRLFLGK